MRKAALSGVRLRVQDNRLNYTATAGALSEAMRGEFQRWRTELIAELSLPEFKPRQNRETVLQLPEDCVHWLRETLQCVANTNFTHMIVKLSGPLDMERAERRLRAVFSRHDLLSARLRLVSGIASLHFAPQSSDILTVTVVQPGADGNAAADLTQLLEQLVWGQFADGAVFRAFLLKISAGESVFGFVLHHFVGDYFSCRTLARETLAALTAPSSSELAPEPRPLQYSDYFCALRDWSCGPGLAYREAFWKHHMAGTPAVRLPDQLSPGDALSAPINTVAFQVEQDLRSGLARTATDSGSSLLEVLVTAKLAALWNLLRREDLVVTAVVAGRDQPALLNMLGNTVNCIPVRVFVRPEMSFAELLERVRESYGVACRYQIPWHMLAPKLEEIGASVVSPTINFLPEWYFNQSERNPISGEMAIQPMSIPAPPTSGLVEFHSSHAMLLCDTRRGLLGSVSFASSRYLQETIEIAIAEFMRCLREFAQDVQRTISADAVKR